jgi:hypothetical protein
MGRRRNPSPFLFRRTSMTTFDQQEIEMVLDLARENPKGFLHLFQQLCAKRNTTVSVDEVKQSMKAWGINPEKGHAPGTNYRPARGRKNRGNY